MASILSWLQYVKPQGYPGVAVGINSQSAMSFLKILLAILNVVFWWKTGNYKTWQPLNLEENLSKLSCQYCVYWWLSILMAKQSGKLS